MNINYLGLDIEFDDLKTWDFICAGKNLKGIFQLETESAGKVLRKIKPRSIDDLSVVNALNRPGSMKFIDEIAAIRDGRKKPEYLHAALEPLLKNTWGTLIYQESLLLIAQKLANFKAKDSATLLKAIGKKDEKKLMSLKESFTQGIKDNNLPVELSEKLFSWFRDFADYSFNKCLSLDTIVETKRGIKSLSDIKIGDEVLSYNVRDNKNHFVVVTDKISSKIDIYEVTLTDGRIIKCSMDHKFMCFDHKMRPLKEIIKYDLEILTDKI